MSNKIKIMLSVFILLCIMAVGMFIYQDKSVNISDEVKLLLEEKGVSNISLTKFGSYSDLKVDIEYEDIPDDNVQAYVNEQVEMLSEQIEVTDRKIVQDGDVVYVSYIVEHNGEIVGQIERDNLMIGTGNYDINFEKALIGRNVGEPFKVELPVEGLEGNAIFNITIESITYFQRYDLTDKLVQEKFNYESVEEYYNHCKDVLQEDKNMQVRKQMEEKIFKELIDRSKFEVDRKEIAEYSKKIVENYEYMAYLYNMDLDTYASEVMGQTLEEFYQFCYDEGEYQIKRYVLVSAIFEGLDYSISDEEYRSMCELIKCAYQEAKSDSKKNAEIVYSIMEKKVYEYLGIELICQ